MRTSASWRSAAHSATSPTRRLFPTPASPPTSDEVGAAAGDGGVEDGMDERDLGLAPDEPGAGAAATLARRRDRGDRGPGLDRLVAAANRQADRGARS